MEATTESNAVPKKVGRFADELEEIVEKKFVMNLKRLTRRTDAITLECFLEFLTFLNNDGIEELQFIEEAYTSVMFNHAALDVAVCSVEVAVSYSLKTCRNSC